MRSVKPNKHKKWDNKGKIFEILHFDWSIENQAIQD